MINPNPDQPLEDRIAELAKQASQVNREDTNFLYPPSNIRAWVERKWRPLFRKKEVIYMGAQENPIMVLDGSKHNLRDIANPLVSPDGNRVLFIASETENHPNIYVVSRNGDDLREITFYGEGQYQDDSLKWVHPLRFRYKVPAHTKQTYDYKCKSQPHTNEVRLLEINMPHRVIAYYNENGNLVEESFTEQEIEEAVSYFKEQLADNIQTCGKFQKRLEKKLEEAKKEEDSGHFTAFPSGKKKKTLGDLLLDSQMPEQVSAINTWLTGVQDFIETYTRMLDKQLPYLEDHKIAFIRSYLGFMDYYLDYCKGYVDMLCKN